MSRKGIIKLFTFLGGIYFFLEYVLPDRIFGFQFNAFHDQITTGFMAVTAMTFGLGLINIAFIHGGAVLYRREGWFQSLGLIVGLLLMLFVTARDWRGSARIQQDSEGLNTLAAFAAKIEEEKDLAPPSVPLAYHGRRALFFTHIRSEIARLMVATRDVSLAEVSDAQFQIIQTEARNAVNALTAIREDDAKPLTEYVPLIRSAIAARSEQLRSIYKYSLDSQLYTFLYDGIFISLGTAMFALLGFYMAAAAYRAFRVRSLESGLMMGAALIVMLGQTSFGIGIWEGFVDVRLWLLSTPSTGAFRAVKLGAAVAGLVMAFRMWLSIESESFARTSSESAKK